MLRFERGRTWVGCRRFRMVGPSSQRSSSGTADGRGAAVRSPRTNARLDACRSNSRIVQR